MNPILSSLFAVSIGYVLGSIPSGFLITKVSTGKNILKIGWERLPVLMYSETLVFGKDF